MQAIKMTPTRTTAPVTKGRLHTVPASMSGNPPLSHPIHSPSTHSAPHTATTSISTRRHSIASSHSNSHATSTQISGNPHTPRKPSQIHTSNGGQAEPFDFATAMYAYALQMQQQQEEAARNGPAHILGARVHLSGVNFQPAGVEHPLLNSVSMLLPANRLGLVMGRSGSGKTTLLQLLAGFTEQDSGQVSIAPPTNNQIAGDSGSSPRAPAAAPSATASGSSMEQRMQRVGLVFQFPERHFLGEDLYTELTFGWPQQPGYELRHQDLATRMHQVLEAVGLGGIKLSVAPSTLSGGQQRRLALAIQLVRRPSLLLLDEPLAGLDWKARAEVVQLLSQLKSQATLLVVSHDLTEVAPLVDCAWRMQIGGTCEPVVWPPLA